MNQWKLINHTFKFREGDTDEKGGCTFIGGSWKDVTTDELSVSYTHLTLPTILLV